MSAAPEAPGAMEPSAASPASAASNPAAERAVPGRSGGRRAGTLLLADISGYTGFLHGVAEAHRALVIESDEPPPAYELISSLLDAMLTAIAPPFRFVKFEGDALFAVCDDDLAKEGAGLLGCLRACHAAFVERLAEAGSVWTCRCGSCSRIDDLGVKFVVHHGDYVVQRIATSEELAGPDVIVVHRLLKNTARDVVASGAYALVTDAAIAALGVPTERMVPATQTYEDLAPVPAHVLALG